MIVGSVILLTIARLIAMLIVLIEIGNKHSDNFYKFLVLIIVIAMPCNLAIILFISEVLLVKKVLLSHRNSKGHVVVTEIFCLLICNDNDPTAPQ